MADMEIRLTDNSGELLRQLNSKIHAALEAVGQQAESHAKNNITEAGRVDTGRMRNSVSHTVVGNEVYIGSNLEYAVWHEIGTGIYASQPGGRQSPWYYYDRNGVLHRTVGLRPIHFLKNAASQHTDEYKRIIETILKSE